MKAFKTQEGKEAVFNYYNVLLEKLTVPHEELNVNTRFGNTFVLAVGDKTKPPVVLLHGSSMNSAMWIGDINILNRDYRVYAPDIPGEPGRSNDEQLPFDTSDYMDWLFDVMSGLSLDKITLAGASLGAWLAAKFSISYSNRISRLILLCPAGIGSQNEAFKEIALSLLTKGEEGVNELFTQINGGNPVPEAVMNYSKLIAWAFNSRQEPIPMFSDDELKHLTMPCIVFVGAKDIMLRSDETADRLSKLVPHAEVIILPDKGHSLSGLADKYVSFLEKH